MKPLIKRYSSLILIAIFMAACGSDGNFSGNNGDPLTSSSDQEINRMQAAAYVVAMIALTDTDESHGSSLLGFQGSTQETQIQAMETDDSSEACVEELVPDPRPDFIRRIYGSKGGFCDVTLENDNGTDSAILLNCSEYTICANWEDGGVSNIALNGLEGLTTTFDELTNQLHSNLSTEDLIVTLDGVSCPFTMNMTMTFDFTTEQVTANGCISVCGDDFTFGGIKSFDEI